MVLLREDEGHHVDEFEFEPGNVYTVDVLFSTGAGTPVVRDARPTVFKRNPEKRYQLKSAAAKALLAQVDRDFAAFPFCLRTMEDEKQARLGLKECVEHELFTPCAPVFEKPGDLVAHFQYTVLVMPSGNVTLAAGLPADAVLPTVSSPKALSPELLELVNRPLEKKKKKGGAAAGAPAPAAAVPPS